jgi:two-component system sensor histidine kinase YesM
MSAISALSNNDNLVRVREELSHIEDYYYIQKYRFEDRFEMKVCVEQDEIYDLYLPKMTLQPLVENAMVHGLEQVEHKGLIELHLFRTDRNLMIIISDNGIGMSQEQLNQLNEKMQQEYMSGASKRDRHNGIAARNVNTRLKITFGEESGIRYRSLEGAGTDAVITLPAIDVFTRVKYENQYER